MSQVQKFLSQFTQWEIERGFPKSSASKLPKVLRRIFEEELPARDSYSHVIQRDLTNSANLSCAIMTEVVWCYPIKNKYLMTGVVYPYWRRGLREICRDENVYSSVSSFLHFASQYIARSRAIDIIGAIALTYDKACDFRGKTFQEISIGPDFFSLSEVKKELDHRAFSKPFGSKERRLIAWFEVLNSLDPFINRVIFCYTKAVDLFENNFAEESITALDNTINVIEQFVRERLKASDVDQRLITAYVLGMNIEETKRLRKIYELRCYFGAHPGFSKWWDFFEIYESDFQGYFEVVKKLIYKVCLAEQANRIIEKKPVSWSEWLNANIMMLWNSIWFHRIPL